MQKPALSHVSVVHGLTRITILLILLAAAAGGRLAGQGKVYLVLGSDTAIWEGMDVGRYQCTYNLALYTDPSRNGHKVMQSSFRQNLVDSYGQPMKLTWWMMAGNIFRYATNKNVPLPNTMTLHLMQKYHGPAVSQWGDELSLHYHTFAWTDYNQDGKTYWNQAGSFDECRDDFDVTMAQYLLEENVYPVSFRSGWHAMDNGWQRYLDELLPFSMHNDWPAKRSDPTEPIDNVYDWSRASSLWVPFHPSPDDYQVPGTCRGWNLRSKHVGSVNPALMDSMFARAQRGVDQVACLWGHLPETDFLDNLRKVDSIAHRSASKYTGVAFRYCTAVEAMQRWLGTNDSEPPSVRLLEETHGDQLHFIIQTSEPIFQNQPFVAIKDVYERYLVAPCDAIGPKVWRTSLSYSKQTLAKVAVAVLDTVGNLRAEFIPYRPDDRYIDDLDDGFSEVRGTWLPIPGTTWGTTSRATTLSSDDSVKVQWKAVVGQSTRYNIFAQLPPTANPAGNLLFRVYDGSTLVDTVRFRNPLTANEWVFLSSSSLTSAHTCTVELVVSGGQQTGRTVGVDVVKISPLVRERQVSLARHTLEFGDVSEGDTVRRDLTLSNLGSGSLTVSGVSSTSGELFSSAMFPLQISPMGSASIPVHFSSNVLGTHRDTLYLLSDDPLQPRLPIPVTANVQSYFLIVDNEDSARYVEHGQWATSVAQAYGPSSRYCYVSSVQGGAATFSAVLKKSGIYDVQEIVPTTANAADKALYTVSIEGVVIDSVVIDQNQGSGSWVTLRRCKFLSGKPIAVRVIDTGRNIPGRVLRADAIRFVWIGDIASADEEQASTPPEGFILHQNYPNPFNATTVINFSLPVRSRVRITVANTLGQEVAQVAEGAYEAGLHTAVWQASNIASGTYFCRFEAVAVQNSDLRSIIVRRMLLLR